MKKVLIISILISLFASCNISRWDVTDEEYTVTLYGCDGNIIKQWETRGKMYRSYDGYYFMNKETSKFTEIVGTIVIEQK